MLDEDENDKVVEGEPKNLVLARIYDALVEIPDIAEINEIQLDDGTQLVAILLKKVRYSDEFGFEQIE